MPQDNIKGFKKETLIIAEQFTVQTQNNFQKY
jgi:hypothetical protein